MRKPPDMKVLQALSDRPSRVGDLVRAGVTSKSTAYRTLNRLQIEGLVRQEDQIWRLTDHGAMAMAGPRPGSSSGAIGVPVSPALGARLALFPTPEHRAFAVIGLCALSARRHAVREDHHPSLLLIGPPLRWKSFMGSALVLMAGDSVDRQVIAANSETAGSLLARRGPRGKRVSEREAVKAGFLVLDEYGRATSKVRKQIEVIMRGSLQIPFENETLEISAVPILTTNPAEQGDSLEERTRLDAAMLRRSVILNLGEIEIPESIVSTGGDRLKALADLGEIEVPAPSEPDPTWSTRIRKGLKACLGSPETQSRIDVLLLENLVRGATSFVPREHALGLALRNYLVLVATLGWTRPDWEERLAACLDSTAPVEENTATASYSETVLSRADRYDYEAALGIIAQACEETGLAPLEIAGELRALAPLRRRGFEAEDLAALVAKLIGDDPPATADARLRELLNRSANLDKQLERKEADLKGIEEAVSILAGRREAALDQLRDVEVPPQAVRLLASLNMFVRRIGVGARDLEELTKAVGAASQRWSIPVSQAAKDLVLFLRSLPEESQDMSFREVLEEALRLGKEGIGLRELSRREQARVDELQGEAAVAERRCVEGKRLLAELRQQLRDHETELGLLERRCSDLRREARRRRSQLLAAEELFAYLGGDLKLNARLGEFLLALPHRPHGELAVLDEAVRRRARTAVEDLLYRWGPKSTSTSDSASVPEDPCASWGDATPA